MGLILGSEAPRLQLRLQGGSDRRAAGRPWAMAPPHPAGRGTEAPVSQETRAPAGQVQDAGAEAPSARPPVAMGLAGDEGRLFTASNCQRLTVLLAPLLAAGGLAVVSGPEVSLPLLGSSNGCECSGWNPGSAPGSLLGSQDADLPACLSPAAVSEGRSLLFNPLLSGQ